jgi:hypothetical protein
MFLIGIAALIILGYAAFRLWAIVWGPELTIEYPESGFTAKQELINIRGQAKRISSIYLNDRQIFTDRAGNFEQSLLLAPGYNIMTVRVEDRFGRHIIKKLELVLEK